MSAAAKVIPSQVHPDLCDLRDRIDSVDKELVSLLEARAALVLKVGQFKKLHQLPAHDPVRESKIKNKIRNLVSADSPLSVSEMESLFMTLVEKFRFFEDVHMKQDVILSQKVKPLIDFDKSQTVVLWGFGLLGSSLYLALRESVPNWKFLVFDPFIHVDSFAEWKKQRGLTNIDLVNSEQIHQAQLYILAGPVDANARNLENFDFPKSSLVFDLGSTKNLMSEIFQKRCAKKAECFTYIGGHPLAGKESSGFENGDALLFYGKTFCWVADESLQIDGSLKTTFDKLAAMLGARPLWLQASEHDAALAWTSHLPQIISSALAHCLVNKSFTQTSEIFPGVISELLRISGSNYSMWQSIITTNQQPLQDAISELVQQLKQVQSDLQSDIGTENIFKKSNEFYTTFKKGG